MRGATAAAGAAVLAAALSASPATAEGPFGLQLEGSFGEGGFKNYRPPITNPIFNESPFITTEVRPIYVYHDIPDDFVTGGGNVNVAAIQARLAVNDRLGIIATTDGYSWLDFDNVLPDADGWNDITVGVKYALISDPASGLIVTPGLRYTIPVGNIDTAGIDLNGHAGGYFNPFVSAAKIWDKMQLQGMVGANISFTDDGTSTFLAALHADYEVLPGFYPMLEMNLFAPIDGGDQLAGPVLGKLTGADLFDLASDEPETILTLGGGFRYAVTDNVMFGVGADVNVLQDKDHVYGWRILTDLVVHF
ncbi:hypothetical protein M1105_05935 [Limibaculum sp. FT325]|uniref:hypothetical protein n=1 Tax=Thermohalobaculum sediminis TaxID=2939436 RepID=UPI0020C0306D|nr:hypothetical protein [Limibaculum sediminis]MCL5776527.1 hypothetical protein [Limibaculum sediminis]